MADPGTFLGENTREILGIERDDEVEELTEWTQRGGETFSCDFILRKDENRYHLIAKACIKYCPIETVDEWMSRREIIEYAGIEVPTLFKRDGAVVIEEFIPFSLHDAYTTISQVQKTELEEAFITTYASMANAGFWPLSLHDARSRGDDVVVIDMGEDIGGPHPVDLDTIEVHDLAKRAFHRMTH